MKVFIVMANDSIEAVFCNEANANQYVEDRRKEDAHNLIGSSRPIVFWRSYEFNTNDEIPITKGIEK